MERNIVILTQKIEIPVIKSPVIKRMIGVLGFIWLIMTILFGVKVVTGFPESLAEPQPITSLEVAWLLATLSIPAIILLHSALSFMGRKK